jgi:hypothetical protein
MQAQPLHTSILFIAVTVFSVFMAWKASRYSKTFIMVMIAWLILNAFAALSFFYTNTYGVPPRFALAVVPALLGIVVLFSTRAGRKFIDGLDTGTLILLNIVRIPVEIGLFLLFSNKAVPEVMTFEGRNFDIISGITAPVIWLRYTKFQTRKLLLSWNFLCLALLVNIVGIAIVAAPFEFQQIAFDQPNVAVMYFPYIWLPCCIVPLVLLTHLAMIRKLIIGKAVRRDALVANA